MTDPGPPPLKTTGGRLRWTLWALGLLVAVPTLVTLFGVVTSPPHAQGVPVGHLLYLDADQPSEKTTALRGLYIARDARTSRLLVHENEPQDADAGDREWITQPAASPDGTEAAYLKQNILIQEETHTQDTQLWVISLTAPRPQPRMLLDLTKLGFKQIVGLTWTLDGRSIVFSQDTALYRVPASSPSGGKPSLMATLRPPVPLKLRPDLSATQDVTLEPPGTLAFAAQTVQGDEVMVSTTSAGQRILGNYAASVWAINGKQQIAYVELTHPNRITVQNLTGPSGGRSYTAKWGWSVFGGRRITSLHWSPDGNYLAYTVSKPPIPDGELFDIRLADGVIRQIPVRTGRAAWDWTQ